MRAIDERLPGGWWRVAAGALALALVLAGACDAPRPALHARAPAAAPAAAPAPVRPSDDARLAEAAGPAEPGRSVDAAWSAAIADPRTRGPTDVAIAAIGARLEPQRLAARENRYAAVDEGRRIAISTPRQLVIVDARTFAPLGMMRGRARTRLEPVPKSSLFLTRAAGARPVLYDARPLSIVMELGQAKVAVAPDGASLATRRLGPDHAHVRQPGQGDLRGPSRWERDRRRRIDAEADLDGKGSPRASRIARDDRPWLDRRWRDRSHRIRHHARSDRRRAPPREPWR